MKINFADFMEMVGMAKLRKPSSPSETGIVTSPPRTFMLSEGDVLTVKTAAASTCTVDQYSAAGILLKTTPMTASSTKYFGAFSGTNRMVVTRTSGTIDATVGDAGIAAAIMEKNSNGDPIALRNGDASVALSLGPMSFTQLPPASSYPGYRARITDLGGVMLVSNGTRWLPENGRLTIGTMGAASSMTGVTETIVKQWLVPIGLIQNYDRFRLRATFAKSAAAETAAFALRFGPLGTVADTQIFSNSNMATTNISMGVDVEFKRLSATSILRTGVGSIGSSYNAVSTAAFAAAVTVSNMDSNVMYASITLRSATTGAETLTMHDGVLDLFGYVP